MRISLSTVAGVFAGAGFVVWGVTSATDNWKMFINIPSIQIVLGGTITATFIGYKWRYIKKAFINIFEIFFESGINANSLKNDVGTLLGWAEKVQQEGSPAYDSISSSLDKKNEYAEYLFSLIASGYTSKEIRDFGENSIEENYFRNITGANILDTMAAAAPAFGMIGTLIGLIVMLGKMENPADMGPGLAMALITTLYGVLLARYVFDPTSTKVKQIYSINRFREYLILEGIIMIAENQSTFYMKDKLNSFLDRKNLYKLETTSKKGN